LGKTSEQIQPLLWPVPARGPSEKVSPRNNTNHTYVLYLLPVSTRDTVWCGFFPLLRASSA